MPKFPRLKALISRIGASEFVWPLMVFLLFWGLMHLHSGIYEFSLGDNLVQFFPGMMHNGRELFSGSPPLLNYHHFLGYESLLTGYYGGFYLPTYVAYFLAVHIFGNAFYLLGFLAFYHYVLGFLGFYVLLRRFLGHKVYCCIAALGYVFAAKYINYAAEWWYVLVPMAYAPWISLFSLKVIDRLTEPVVNRKKMIAQIVLLGLLLSITAFAGNGHLTIMVYAYGALFAIIYCLLKIHKVRWTRLIYLVFMIPFVVAGMAVMLLCSEYVKESDSKRGHKSAAYMIGNKLAHGDALKHYTMAPFNHKIDFTEYTYETAHERFQPQAFWPVGFINTAGTILFFLCLPFCFLGIIGRILKFDDRKKVIVGGFLIAALSLVMACGYAPIYEFLAKNESLSKLAHAHKNYIVTIFYISLFACLVVGSLLETLPEKVKKFSYRIVLILGIFTTIVNIVVITQITQWNFTDEKVPIVPNPNLPKEKRMVHMGDFFRYQPGKDVCGEYMGFKCASLFDYHVFGSYEPLLPIQHSWDLNHIAGRTDAGYHDFPYGLYEIIREFGVCNVVGRYSYRSPEDAVREMRIPEGRYVISEVSEKAYLIEDLDCYEYKSDVGTVTSREYRGDRIVFELSEVSEDTILHIRNYFNPRYKGYDQDGNELELIRTEGKGGSIIGKNMIDVPIPAGTTKVQIIYHHPFLRLIFWWTFIAYILLAVLWSRYFFGSSEPELHRDEHPKTPKVNKKPKSKTVRKPLKIWNPLAALRKISFSKPKKSKPKARLSTATMKSLHNPFTGIWKKLSDTWKRFGSPGKGLWRPKLDELNKEELIHLLQKLDQDHKQQKVRKKVSKAKVVKSKSTKAPVKKSSEKKVTKTPEKKTKKVVKKVAKKTTKAAPKKTVKTKTATKRAPKKKEK